MLGEGLLLVLSGPSGAGKGTLLKELKKMNENVLYSISATTRAPRTGEIDGKNYFFKTVEEFQSMIDNSELLEWVKYCDNYYGTPRKYIEECLAAGNDVILEIEVEGAQNIKKKHPECVPVFIVPPSFQELRRRIAGRGTEGAEVINKRLEKAKMELRYIGEYEYVVVNDQIKEAAKKINSIIIAEKLKVERSKEIVNKMKLD